MKEKTWELLEEKFRQWPQSRASQVTPEQFDKTMYEINGYIDVDYRMFVLKYGGGVVGSYPIYGLCKAEFMGTIDGRSTAADITRWFREQKWPGVDEWLVFSIDQGGNPIGFAKNGTIWISDQMDFGQIDLIAESFEDFLLTWCLGIKK